MHNMSNIKYGMFACLFQEYGMLKVLHGYGMWNSDSKYGMFTEFYQYGMLNSNCKYGMLDTVLQYSMFSLNGMRNGSTWPCLRSKVSVEVLYKGPYKRTDSGQWYILRAFGMPHADLPVPVPGSTE